MHSATHRKQMAKLWHDEAAACWLHQRGCLGFAIRSRYPVLSRRRSQTVYHLFFDNSLLILVSRTRSKVITPRRRDKISYSLNVWRNAPAASKYCSTRLNRSRFDTSYQYCWTAKFIYASRHQNECSQPSVSVALHAFWIKKSNGLHCLNCI